MVCPKLAPYLGGALSWPLGSPNLFLIDTLWGIKNVKNRCGKKQESGGYIGLPAQTNTIQILLRR